MSRISLLLLTVLLCVPAALWAGDGDKQEHALAIGDPAPGFKLEGTDGKKHALDSFVEEADATVVVFTCNTCPFSIAYEPVLIDLANAYAKRQVSFVLINSNDPEIQPGDSFDAMVTRAKEQSFPFPYLFDETQQVAKAYGATVTPHIFLVDSEGKLRYRGRINDNRDPDEVETHDLKMALDAVLAGKEVPVADTRAFGCTIKWKKASS